MLKFEVRERLEAKLIRRSRISVSDFFVQLPDGTILQDAEGRERKFVLAEGHAWLNEWKLTGSTEAADKAAAPVLKQEKMLVEARARQAEELADEVEEKTTGKKKRKK